MLIAGNLIFVGSMTLALLTGFLNPLDIEIVAFLLTIFVAYGLMILGSIFHIYYLVKNEELRTTNNFLILILAPTLILILYAFTQI